MTPEQILAHKPRVLSQAQREAYFDNGYICLERIIPEAWVERLRQTTKEMVERSRSVTKSDAVWDLEAGHSAARPRLRRLSAPCDHHPTYWEYVSQSLLGDIAADLLGPDVKFHHSKLNFKSSEGGTEVKWHQDFPFTPHSNADLVTALLALDEVDETNGPLIAALGSHRAGLAEIWHDGKFTGIAGEAASATWAKEAKVFTMKAGSVCLMHTRAGHCSGPNRGTRPRRLFIAVYSAEDAIPLSPNPLPSKHEGLLVRGQRTGRVRSVPFELTLPQRPSTGSFFNQQVGYDG